MGFRINYIGAKCTPEELAEGFRLKLEQKETEMPDYQSWITKMHESDWTILWLEDENFIENNHKRLPTISKKYDLITCHVNETCMWSSAELWSKGNSIWKITHAGDGKDKFDLTETGILPEGLETIKNTHFKKQKTENNCDYIFEIPIETANLFLLFRYDQYIEPHCVDHFQIIEPKKRGFISSLFT